MDRLPTDCLFVVGDGAGQPVRLPGHAPGALQERHSLKEAEMRRLLVISLIALCGYWGLSALIDSATESATESMRAVAQKSDDSYF